MEEKVLIQNKKGLKLAAVVHKPEGEGKFPAVIILHGFGGRKDEPHMQTLAKDLETAGFVAIRFEASGMGESEGGVAEFLLTNYYNDLDSVYTFVANQDYVDTERIGIVGHSLGAVLTLLYAAKNPQVKVLCAISPFITFSHVHLDIPMRQWKEKGVYPKQKPNGQIVQIPYAFVEDADSVDVLDMVRSLTQPKLIIAGAADEVVDLKDTKRIYEVASQPKKFAVLEGIGHRYKESEEQLSLVNQKVIAFFQKNL